MSMYFDIVWREPGTRKIVLRILLQLQTMLADSRQDVGHFWDQDPRRNGMEPILTNRMESGTELLRTIGLTLPKADILHIFINRRRRTRVGPDPACVQTP